MSIPLSRAATIDDLGPGQWCNDAPRHTPGAMNTIVVCCPGCSGKTDLTADHTIEADGKVHPAFACATCQFFEPIVLTGWGARLF